MSFDTEIKEPLRWYQVALGILAVLLIIAGIVGAIAQMTLEH